MDGHVRGAGGGVLVRSVEEREVVVWIGKGRGGGGGWVVEHRSYIIVIVIVSEMVFEGWMEGSQG